MTPSTPRFTLVLGAGGTVGLAYHAGVLKALSDVAGIEASDAELIIGTSAGSVAGAYLRSGYTSEDFWRLAMGTHPSLDGIEEDELARRRRELFTPAWESPAELFRRGIGSSYALLRSLTKIPGPPIPAVISKRFPAGLFTMASGQQQLEAELPTAWPQHALWLCAFDIVRRRRIVLGHDRRSMLSLPRSVLASCAIPGIYRPVRDGRRVLVDGGVTSSTNLDLAVDRAPQLVIAVAPMSFDTEDGPSTPAQLARRRASVALAREARAVRALGHHVVMIRPCRKEIGMHGRNLMRLDTLTAVTTMAYECAAATLESLGGLGIAGAAGAGTFDAREVA